MSEEAKNAQQDVIELLLHDHTDDMDAEWTKALKSAARDLEPLARLRVHKSTPALLAILESDANDDDQNEFGLLLAKLLRGLNV